MTRESGSFPESRDPRDPYKEAVAAMRRPSVWGRANMIHYRRFAALIVSGFSLVPEPVVDRAKWAAQQTTGVPEEYAGEWVCQTFTPGYNLTPYGGDNSQPLTNKVTTPGSVAVVKLSLRTDATYQTPSAKGRYAFDPATKTLTWLDGPHQGAVTRTQLGRRENGAPKMGFVLNRRYYGCYMAARR